MKPSIRWTIVVLVLVTIGITWLLWTKRDQQPIPAKGPIATQPTAPKPEPSPAPVTPKADKPKAKPAPRPMAKTLSKASTQPTYALVEVLFGTDRQQLGGENWNEYFGIREDVFRYGICKVSIPARHERGRLERPFSLLIFEFPEDPAKHIMLRDIAMHQQDAFFASLRARLEKSSRNQALLFVHGFNNSFADAARRTAQLAYDLDFKGVPIFYSWPSFGSVEGYGADTETIKLATAKLGAFLDQILKDTQANELFLIAHSMGNEALTKAFIDVVAKRPDARRRVKELVLVAPDIDTRVFARDIGPALAAAGAGVTLYAASDDVALLSAKSIRAGFPRAGDISDGVVILKGIETVDATGADTSLIGHAYFVTRDLYYLINNGFRAEHRYLTTVKGKEGQYWKLTKE